MKSLIEKITVSDNNKNLQFVIDNYNLGPVKTSIYPSANKPYWDNLSIIWRVAEKEARQRLCANCEYFNNTPKQMIEMLSIPINEFDKDGGGRGFCVKFDFICHNLRTCSAWEEKKYIMPKDAGKIPKKTGIGNKSLLTYKKDAK